MIIIKEKMQIKIFKLKQGGELLVKCNNMYWICKYIHTHVQRHTEDKVYPLNTIEQKNVVCCCPNVLLPFVFLSITHLSIDINRLWSRSLNIWFFFKCIPKLISREGDKFIYISNLNNIAMLSIYANFGEFI